MDLFNISGALFSEDRKYRYRLWRMWNSADPLVMFIGLNPSKADETKPDPTITRVINFAKRWGYGGVYMMNLFAYVSTQPEVLLTVDDPQGDNDSHLLEVAHLCDNDIIFAWGAFKQNKKRAEEVKLMFPNGRCLEKNKDGSPKHPLYVKGDIMPIDYGVP